MYNNPNYGGYNQNIFNQQQVDGYNTPIQTNQRQNFFPQQQPQQNFQQFQNPSLNANFSNSNYNYQNNQQMMNFQFQNMEFKQRKWKENSNEINHVNQSYSTSVNYQYRVPINRHNQFQTPQMFFEQKKSSSPTKKFGSIVNRNEKIKEKSSSRLDDTIQKKIEELKILKNNFFSGDDDSEDDQNISLNQKESFNDDLFKQQPETEVKKHSFLSELKENKRAIFNNGRFEIRSNWEKYNGGHSSPNNPQFRLSLKRKARITITCEDNNPNNSFFVYITHCPAKLSRNVRRKKTPKKDWIAKSKYINTKCLSFSVDMDPVDVNYCDFLIVVCSGEGLNDFKISISSHNYSAINFFEEIVETQKKRKESSCLEVLDKYLDPSNPPFLKSDPIPELLEFCKKNNVVFKDSAFPPNEVSLNRDDGRGKKVHKAIWKRVDDFLDEPEIFVDGIEIEDLIQGTLGDCWLCQAISTAAMNDQRITKLFITKNYNKYGVYCLKLFHNGEWKYILIDDYFPIDQKTNTFTFAHCSDENELWVPMIEKAMAKIFGSYRSLSSRNMNIGLSTLTGGDSYYKSHSMTTNSSGFDKEDLWKEMKYFQRQGWLMGASSHHSRENFGIINSHAYSIMSLYDKIPGHRGLRLVKIRNTWGEGEWTGKWSDSDYRNWTEQMKSLLNFEKKDDGIFYMDYDDYFLYFTDTTFCKVTNDLLPFTKKIRGDWMKEYGGTKKMAMNPKFPLVINQNNTKVFIRLIMEENQGRRREDIYTIILLVSGKIKGFSIPKSQIVQESRYSNHKTQRIECTIKEKGVYHVICCADKKNEEKYTLLVQSDKPCEFGGKFNEEYKNSLKLSGNWDPCGGYMSFNNIQFNVFCREEGTTNCSISLERSGGIGNEIAMMIVILHPGARDENGTGKISSSQIYQKSIFLKSNCLNFEFSLKRTSQPYTILAFLEKPVTDVKYEMKLKSNNSLFVSAQFIT